MKIQIRTKDNLVELLKKGISHAWRVNKGRLNSITEVEIYDFSGNAKISGAFDRDNSQILDNGRVAVAFKDAKIEQVDFKWIGQNPIKYVSANEENVGEEKDQVQNQINDSTNGGLLTSNFKIPENKTYSDFIVEKYFEVHADWYPNKKIIPVVKKIIPRLGSIIEDADSEIGMDEYDLLRLSGKYEYSLTGLITRLLFDENLLGEIFKQEHLQKLLSNKSEYINGKFSPSEFIEFDENGIAEDDGVEYELHNNDYEHPSYSMYEEIISSTISIATIDLLREELLNEDCDDYCEWDENHIEEIKQLFVDEDSFNDYFNQKSKL